MIWGVLLGCIVIVILLYIYDIFRGKPTRKSALKRQINMWAYLLLGFGMLFNILMIFILAMVGTLELAKSADINVIIISNGFLLMFNIVLGSFVFVVVLDALNMIIRKKKTQIWYIYYNWIEKLDKEGFFKYTVDEKEYNKKQDIKSKEQIRRWFPFIKKFDKKVKDAI